MNVLPHQIFNSIFCNFNIFATNCHIPSYDISYAKQSWVVDPELRGGPIVGFRRHSPPG